MNRDGILLLPGVYAPHVYVRAWAPSCFHSLNYQYPNLSEGADRVAGQLRGDKECPFSGDRVAGQLRGDKECPFSGVTKPGRVWRKVPESDGVCTGCSISGPAAVSLLESCIRLRSVLIMMSRFMRGPVKLGIFPKV